MDSFSFSVIIVTRNRACVLPRVLRSLIEMEYPASGFEVIIVDNGSTDGTSGVVTCLMDGSGLNWKTVREERKGICQARNTGMQQASGTWVVYLDDDAIVMPGWLQAYENAIKKYPEAMIFGGPASLDEKLIRPWWWCRKFDWTMSCQDYGETLMPFPEGGHPYGLNMMIRRDVLEQNGGFDPRMDDETSSFADETELFVRLMKKGALLIYVPGTRVIHCVEQDRLTWKSYMARRELAGRSHAYLDYHHNTDFRHPLLKHIRIAVEDFFRYFTPAVFVQELREWRGYRKYMKEISPVGGRNGKCGTNISP